MNIFFLGQIELDTEAEGAECHQCSSQQYQSAIFIQFNAKFLIGKRDCLLDCQFFGNGIVHILLIVLDELKVDSFKTKVVADCLKAIGAEKKTLIILADNNAFAVKSANNIVGVQPELHNYSKTSLAVKSLTNIINRLVQKEYVSTKSIVIVSDVVV